MAQSKNTNPFLDEDDDIGDFEFVYGPNSGRRNGANRDIYQNDTHSQIQASKERALDSSHRALASIYESERMGIDTAEELVHQGEQLDRVESNVDKINQDLKTTQRHLTSIKSVFGGIKNWFSREKANTQPEETPERSSKLAETIEKGYQGSTEHPIDRIRREDNEAGTRGSYGQTQRGYNDQLDDNLDNMSHGMARLKDLANGLGTEITSQNQQLDRIDRKAEHGLYKIDNQNTQMRKILK